MVARKRDQPEAALYADLPRGIDAYEHVDPWRRIRPLWSIPLTVHGILGHSALTLTLLVAMQQAGPRYTAEEKAQLLANLDLEVSHRVRQLEELLADTLENFKLRHEGLVSRVPRLVRDVTLREFAKYNGDIQACLQGLQRERLGGEVETIDKTTRKRKWVESQETEAKAGPSTDVSEPSKAAKSARTVFATPKKKPGPSFAFGTAQRGRLPSMKTPGTARTLQRIPSHAASPSPHKQAVRATPLPRPTSPSKIPFAAPSKPTRPPGTTTTSRVPSTNHFNPQIPASSSSSYPRWPRQDEAMVSVNGSPLANPLKLGFDLSGWLSRVVETGRGDDGKSKGSSHTRTNSIIVRTASSSSTVAGDKPGGSHQRSNSQTSNEQGSQPSHSRSNSRTDHNGRATHTFVPNRTGLPSSSSQHSIQSTQSNTSSSLMPSPLAQPLAALVAVSTADGHLLEFDPFKTSPGEIDALEDISDEAKKQAKDDMRRLVQEAMERWRIT